MAFRRAPSGRGSAALSNHCLGRTALRLAVTSPAKQIQKLRFRSERCMRVQWGWPLSLAPSSHAFSVLRVMASMRWQW